MKGRKRTIKKRRRPVYNLITVSKPDRTSGSFPFASISPIGRIKCGGMATALTAIAFFSFAGIGDRMPAREPIALGQREIILGNWPGKNSAGLPTLGDETAGRERPLRIASYNVHKYMGLDFRRDPERIAAVIRSLDADIVSLQEVLTDPGVAPSSHLRILAEKTGMLVADTSDAKKILQEFGPAKHVKGDVFQGHPGINVPEPEEP